MRKFFIYSKEARTDPNIRDLKSAGRIDVLLHSLISALYASHTFREDVELHLFLMGPPNAPRHIWISYHNNQTISKKDLKKLIEMALKKCKPGQIREVHPGVCVDDRTIEKILEQENSEEVFLLDASGQHLKDYTQQELREGVFILGDHEGFDKQTKKFLKKNTKRLSLGPQIYFTSQAITIINYELDNLE